jgi:ADP-ribosyl-[dinitrogen reductase] hydrolase
MNILKDKLRGCLVGLACGDAVGTTLEFQDRGSFEPITDMVGGGVFDLQPGEWTDDTSMALCLGTSLVEAGGFDAKDQMDRYRRWHDGGYLSSNGRCFDIGNTVGAALHDYSITNDPYSGSRDEFSAGNGSIMRLAPIPMYYSRWEDVIHFSAESSRTTHAAEECLGACRLLGAMLHKAIKGYSKSEILFGLHAPDGSSLVLTERIQAIAKGGYKDKPVNEVFGGSYVVNCLEAALWCFHRTDSYSAAVLLAANLGDDADTTAAVCGQIAGAYYGISEIPDAWRRRLAKVDLIESLAEKLLEGRSHE